MSVSMRLILAGLVVVFAVGPGPVSADDNDHDGRRRDRHGEQKVEWERDGCKYEYRANRKGYRESLKCRGTWRPIERIREDHRSGDCRYRYEADRHGYEERYECKRGWDGFGARPHARPWGGARAPSNAALGIQNGRCDHELLGRILGGAAGAAIGSQVGGGDGRTAAVIGGTIIGALIGGNIGRTMDQTDQNCIGQALEHAPDRQTVRWNDPGNGAQFSVTPVRTEPAGNDRYCREYVTEVIIGGRSEQAYGTACRQPDGSWERVR